MTQAVAVPTRIAGALIVVLLCLLVPAATAAAVAPVNQVPPAVTGVLQEGELLTADPGTWTDSPTSYRYEWFSCGVIPDCGYIAGATQQTYVVDATQVGRTIGVDVTATNADGDSPPEASPLYGPIAAGAYPRIVTAPAITGTPQDGQTLSASPGSWSPAADGYSFQWYACNVAVTVCEPVAGATAQTYGLGPGDVGRRFGVGVVATNAGGPSDEAFSEPTDVVRAAGTTGTDPPPPPPPSSSSSPLPSRPIDETTAPPGSTTPSPFAMLRKLARANGNLELSVRARRAGRFTARATASAALLARGCVSACKRTGRADFGSASLTTSAAGVVKLVIKPSARAARALRKSRTLAVRVTLTFRPAGGGAAASRTYSLTVTGALARRGA